MKNTILVASVVTAIILQGCATPAEVTNMTAAIDSRTSARENSIFYKKMVVGDVEGGSETNPLFTSQVSSEDFCTALQDSLKAAGFMSSETPRYKLSAKLLSLDQPYLGINMTVRTSVDYIIEDLQTGQEVLEETIDASYTATMSDAFIGVARLRLANEGAVKRNIEILLKKLNKITK